MCSSNPPTNGHCLPLPRQHTGEQQRTLELQAAEHAARCSELAVRVAAEADARRDAEATVASLQSENRLLCSQLGRAEASAQVCACSSLPALHSPALTCEVLG